MVHSAAQKPARPSDRSGIPSFACPNAAKDQPRCTRATACRKANPRAVESAKSVVEPVIADYDDEVLQQAFEDEPDCLHVIQPF